MAAGQPRGTGVIDGIYTTLRAIYNALANPGYVDKAANATRITVAGGTLPTVTTVTTVTGLTNIDTYQGRQLAIAQNLAAWASVVRSRIT